MDTFGVLRRDEIYPQGPKHPAFNVKANAATHTYIYMYIKAHETIICRITLKKK